jgi:cytochrome c
MKVAMMLRAGVALCGLFCGVGAMAADAAHGKELFLACAACHTEKADAIGPNLKGVFGRKSASLDDFRYSNSMKRANLVWDAANLRDYLIDPQSKVKGNRMPFGGVANSSEADDIVAFLQTYK